MQKDCNNKTLGGYRVNRKVNWCRGSCVKSKNETSIMGKVFIQKVSIFGNSRVQFWEDIWVGNELFISWSYAKVFPFLKKIISQVYEVLGGK